MNNMLKGKILGIFLCLTLVLSLAAVVLPASPARAAVTGVSIVSPTSSNPDYVKTGNSVTIEYIVNGDGESANVEIFVKKGTTLAGSYAILNVTPGSDTKLATFTIAVAGDGKYDVWIKVNNGAFQATEVDAVIVDNVAPVINILQPVASTCWKGTTTTQQTIQWAATDVAGPANLKIDADLIVGGSLYDNILTDADYPQGAQSLDNYTLISEINSAGCQVRIKATDAAGNSSSYVNSLPFRILATAPTVNFTSPAGGEVWTGDTTPSPAAIRADITGVPSMPASYLIKLLQAGAPVQDITLAWQNITLGPNGQYNISHSWKVANNVCGTDFQIQIIVKDCAGNEGSYTSNGLFTINDAKAPTVAICEPAANAICYAGGTQTIKWTQVDNVPNTNLTDYLYYSTDGGTNWFLITPGTNPQKSSCSDPCSYDWSVPAGISSTNVKIKVEARDQASTPNTGTAISGAFKIVAGADPTVTVNEPNAAGISWEVGSTQNIKWTANDATNTSARLNYEIKLHYGTDPDVTIATLTNQPQGSNTFSWAVADHPSTTCVIIVTATNPTSGLHGADQSDNNFTITTASSPVQTGTIELKTGWNLISLPLIPTNTNPTYILGTVLDQVEKVWYYSGGNSGTWYSYTPPPPSGTIIPSNLTAITDGKAYWVKAKEGCTLTFQGRKAPPVPSTGTSAPQMPSVYSYVAGWNMVGYKSTTTHTVADYLGSNTSYQAPILGFNAEDQIWTSVDNSTSMVPSQGYWVFFTGTGPWQVAPRVD